MTQSNADLPTTHGVVRGVINDNADDAELRLAKPDKLRGGMFNIQDTATTVTPITTVADTWTLVTNDAQGVLTTFDYLPEGVTSDIYDAATGQFDFSELNVGDLFDVRCEVQVTTTSPNTTFDMRFHAGIGSGTDIYIPLVQDQQYKRTGVYSPFGHNIGTLLTSLFQDYPSQIEVKTDDECDIVVSGALVRLFVRGEAS
jgi:hypothetical protein